VEGVVQTLGAEDWRLDTDARERQERLHAALLPLTADDDPLAERIRQSLLEDLRRGSTSGPGIDTEETIAGLTSMGSNLPEQQRRELASDAAGLAADGSLEGALASLRVRLALAASTVVGDGGEGEGPFAFSDEELANAVDAANGSGDRVVSLWLVLDPPVGRVLAVLSRLGDRSPSVLTDAVSRWAESQAVETRTEAIIGLINQEFDASKWVTAIGRHGLDDEAVVSEIAVAVGAAKQGDRRAELVQSLIAVQPSTHRSQRAVADLMMALLQTGKKNDFDIALQAARALGQNHRSAERLKQALKAATDDHGYQIPKKATEALAAAGVQPAKKSFRDGAFDRFRSFFR
jgi:hypothetical protein